MFRLSRTMFPPILDQKQVCFDFLDQNWVCFDCLDLCFDILDRNRYVLTLCSNYVSNLLIEFGIGFISIFSTFVPTFSTKIGFCDFFLDSKLVLDCGMFFLSI